MDTQGQIQNILIAIRDHTLRRQLQDKVSATHDRMDHLQIKLREILEADPRRAIPFIRELGADTARVFDYRRLHTIKGTARSLGLRDLAERVHQLENYRGPESQEADQAWDAYRQTLDDYQELCKSFMVDHNHPLARSRSLNLLDAVSFHLPGLLELLQKGQVPFAGIDVQDKIHPWDRALLERIDEVLLHALTNSVEHGFIRPMARGRALEPAYFQVNAWHDGHAIHVTVRDNGAGVDWERLRKKASQRNLAPDPGTLQSLLFEAGFSTAETVSQNSGRGVGLNVIKQISDELGAMVHLDQDHDTHGACLHLHIPQVRVSESA